MVLVKSFDLFVKHFSIRIVGISSPRRRKPNSCYSSMHERRHGNENACEVRNIIQECRREVAAN